jgi:hypothetical protein
MVESGLRCGSGRFLGSDLDPTSYKFCTNFFQHEILCPKIMFKPYNKINVNIHIILSNLNTCQHNKGWKYANFSGYRRFQTTLKSVQSFQHCFQEFTWIVRLNRIDNVSNELIYAMVSYLYKSQEKKNVRFLSWERSISILDLYKLFSRGPLDI